MSKYFVLKFFLEKNKELCFLSVRDLLIENNILEKYYDGWGMDTEHSKIDKNKKVFELFFYNIPEKEINDIKLIISNQLKKSKVKLYYHFN